MVNKEEEREEDRKKELIILAEKNRRKKKVAGMLLITVIILLFLTGLTSIISLSMGDKHIIKADDQDAYYWQGYTPQTYNETFIVPMCSNIFNSTYNTWSYNQSQPLLNTFGKYWYNMTIGSSSGIGNPFDQILNKTSKVTFSTVNATNFTGNGIIPIGGIILWSGTVASIPTCWHLADGTSGTPDLRDVFILGARGDYGGKAETALDRDLGDPSTWLQTGGAVYHSHTADSFDVQNTQTVDANFDGSIVDVAGGQTISGLGVSLGGNIPPFYSLAYIQRTC